MAKNKCQACQPTAHGRVDLGVAVTVAQRHQVIEPVGAFQLMAPRKLSLVEHHATGSFRSAVVQELAEWDFVMDIVFATCFGNAGASQRYSSRARTRAAVSATRAIVIRVIGPCPAARKFSIVFSESVSQ